MQRGSLLRRCGVVAVTGAVFALLLSTASAGANAPQSGGPGRQDFNSRVAQAPLRFVAAVLLRCEQCDVLGIGSQE